MIEPDQILPGQTITLRSEWVDASGSADPTTVDLTVRQLRPGATATTYNAVTVTATTGTFDQPITLPKLRSASGPWEQFWLATWADGEQTAIKSNFTVDDAEAIA